MAEPAIRIIGINRLRGTIGRKLGELPVKRGGRALRSVGELWMTEAKKRTPVRFNALRTSGHVVGPETQGKQIQVRLVFGGPAAPYAAIVHENLTAHHPVGQAKYLESVALERRPGMGKEVAGFMKA